MKKIFILCFIALSAECFAQGFSEEWNIPITGAYQSVLPDWADLDNDGLLDVVLLQKRASGQTFISIWKGDTVAAPQEVKRIEVSSSSVFYLADYDVNNMIDIIIPGDADDAVTILLNMDDFNFTEQSPSLPSFSKMIYADMNNDARPEWIMNRQGEHKDMIFIYHQLTGDENWVAADTIDIQATALELADADGNGFRDLFLSGKVEDDSLFTGFLINNGKFDFTPYNAREFQGEVSKGDINHDGFFDFVLIGKDAADHDVQKIYRSSSGVYVVKDTVFNLIKSSVFMADLNSDGKADVNYWNKNISGDSLSILQGMSGPFDTLSLHEVRVEKFGDAEHDGDLDLLQIQYSGYWQMVLFQNDAPVNHAPGPPLEPRAFSILDHSFITWTRAVDDHTPSSALTYDVYLDELQSSEFDLLHEKRLKVSHGNTGTSNFVLIKSPQAPGLSYAIQSVDNAFHAGTGGICVGTVEACSVTNIEEITLCSQETRVLTAPQNSAWYSFSHGYMASGETFTYTAREDDVVFYFNPLDPDCAHVRAWKFEVKDSVREERDTVYACVGQTIHLSVESTWISSLWQSDQNGQLGNGQSIQYLAEENDKVHVFLSNGTGCVVDQQFEIIISKPDVEITAENNYVYIGRSVQLNATGASIYQWDGSNGLNDTHIPNPEVSPTESTTYRVTGYDSLNCHDDATVLITVERNGFIPSLFTPNNDGNNDLLKVYGVADAPDFVLEIFNRNGSLVYTASLSEITQRGWDGTARGIKQPDGVYFWKVKGKLFSGENIQLNGKDSGSFVLLH